MKKLSLLFVSLLLSTQVAAAASSAPKADVPGWKTANDYFVGKGILPAVTGDPVVTRAELAQALVKITGNVVDKGGYSNCFSDVSDQSFAPAVCFAAKQKWIPEGKDKKFNPNGSATFGVALQAIVRSARFPAAATRGAWYVPFVNVAVKEGIVDKADYTKTIDQNLTRGQLATMLYRLQLGLTQISIKVGSACEPLTPTGVTIAQTGTSTLQDTAIVISDSSGKTCTIAHDPLARADALHPKQQLTPLVPSLEASNEGTSAPMVEKRAYFLSKDGDTWLPYVWELDLKKGTLRQILNAEAPASVRISPKYTFLAYVASSGVDMRAMNLATGLSKSIRRLTTQVTFLKSVTSSRKVSVTDHIFIDAIDALSFNVYNMRDGSLFQEKARAQLDIIFNVRPSRSTK